MITLIYVDKRIFIRLYVNKRNGKRLYRYVMSDKVKRGHFYLRISVKFMMTEDVNSL